MEFPCRGTVTCKNVFESFLRKFVITMSLFTRLGNCSVKRRTNRVFPKPPRCDETTRTESLKEISMLAAPILIKRSPLFRTIPFGPYNRVSLFEIFHSRNRDFGQFEQNTSTNFASFTCIKGKTFSKTFSITRGISWMEASHCLNL